MDPFFKPLKLHYKFFNDNGELVKYKKNQYIVTPTEENKWVYYLVDGYVKVSFSFNDGIDRLLGFFIPGMTFAQSGSFYADEGGGLEYCTVKSSTVLRIPRELFLAKLRSDTNFNLEYTDQVMRNQIFLIDRVVYQGERDIYHKAIRWILFMTKYYGEAQADNTIRLTIPITQDVAANFMHITRESTSTTLGKLKKSGLIEFEKKHLIIKDLSGLNKLLN